MVLTSIFLEVKLVEYLLCKTNCNTIHHAKLLHGFNALIVSCFGYKRQLNKK